MESDWKKEILRLIASLKNSREAEELLGAILTPGELEEFARRWQIFRLLVEDRPQREISSALSVSIATVSRGARELKYGNCPLKKYYKRLYSK